MDEEKWINKLKSRLHDCEETPPADGWERLAGALPQPAQPARRTLIPLWRSWQVAAAAAVVVAVFAAGFWLLNADIAADMQQMHQPGIAQSPSPIPVQTDGRPSATAADSATVLPTAPVAVRPGETVTLAHILPKAAEGEAAALLEAAEATEATKATEASVPDSGNTPAPAAQDAEAAEASSERQPASEPERRRTVRPSSKDKLHLPADDGHRTREGWGMTLAVGNAGGLLAGSQTVPDYVQSDAQGSGITILQDQSMQIPADQGRAS